MVQPSSTRLNTQCLKVVKSTVATDETPTCQRRRRRGRKHLQPKTEIYCNPTDSVELVLRNERAEQRRERSRLAAQIRRNRESQNLMLLQNALPISADVLGLHGLMTEAGDLLSLFAQDEDPVLAEELLMLLDSCDPEFEFNSNRNQQHLQIPQTEQQPGIKRHTKNTTTPESPPAPGTASAINLEKSDIIRITGHTLFLLNHISQCEFIPHIFLQLAFNKN